MKILFLHGLGQDKAVWDHTVNQLNCEEIDCIDVMPQDMDLLSFNDLADRLELQLIEETDPVMICGLSLGAILGLELYIRKPEKISGLVLIAPQYKVPTLLIDIQTIILKCLPNKMFANSGISKQQMIAISSSMKHLDYSDDLKNIACPVHVVCGSKDKANKRAAIMLNELLPKSRLHVVDSANHEVNKDNPNELAKIITQAYAESLV